MTIKVQIQILMGTLWSFLNCEYHSYKWTVDMPWIRAILFSFQLMEILDSFAPTLIYSEGEGQTLKYILFSNIFSYRWCTNVPVCLCLYYLLLQVPMFSYYWKMISLERIPSKTVTTPLHFIIYLWSLSLTFKFNNLLKNNQKCKDMGT